MLPVLEILVQIFVLSPELLQNDSSTVLFYLAQLLPKQALVLLEADFAGHFLEYFAALMQGPDKLPPFDVNFIFIVLEHLFLSK